VPASTTKAPRRIRARTLSSGRLLKAARASFPRSLPGAHILKPPGRWRMHCRHGGSARFPRRWRLRRPRTCRPRCHLAMCAAPTGPHQPWPQHVFAENVPASELGRPACYDVAGCRASPRLPVAEPPARGLHAKPQQAESRALEQEEKVNDKPTSTMPVNSSRLLTVDTEALARSCSSVTWQTAGELETCLVCILCFYRPDNCALGDT
jgi:hypothetical protein